MARVGTDASWHCVDEAMVFIVAPDSKDGPLFPFVGGIETFPKEALLASRLCWPAVR